MNRPKVSRFFPPVSLALLALMVLAAPVVADVNEDIAALNRASKARAAIVKRVISAVVHISVEKTVNRNQPQPEKLPDFFDDEFFRRFFQPRMPREFKQRSLGSGSIVDKKGFILTNNHVVEGADKIIVKLPDGREFEAKLVGADPGTDLAVVKIEGDDLPIAKLGNSDQIEVGESVIAIGNPFGLEQTITAGIVSAKGRSALGVTAYEDFIQTDASINPGNSGGPLINLKGEVVGVNTAIFSRSGGNQGIGFAIPINMARVVMESLINSGRVVRGFLGVVIQNVTDELAAAMGLESKSGVLISHVGPETPAGRAGIRQGDVITLFNRRSVKTSNELRNAVAAIKPGTAVPVNLVRNGKTISLKVKIGEQPSDMSAAIGRPGEGEEKPNGGSGGFTAERELGVVVRDLTPELAREFGYEGLSGVFIQQVEPDSPAAEVGIRQGALIVQMDRKPVNNVREFRRIYAQVPSGKHLLLLVRLGKFTQFRAIKKP